jgi:hypothetical protein
MSKLTREEWIAACTARRVHPTRFVLNPEFYTRKAAQLYARYQVALAVRRGDITKPSSCSACNRTDLPAREIHAHHSDYSVPLNIRWLCRWCHERHHAEEQRTPKKRTA